VCLTETHDALEVTTAALQRPLGTANRSIAARDATIASLNPHGLQFSTGYRSINSVGSRFQLFRITNRRLVDETGVARLRQAGGDAGLPDERMVHYRPSETG